MRVGPMLPTDFAKLKERLDLAKLEYAVNFDQAVKENPSLIKPPDRLAVYPTYQGIEPYIYMDLGPQALLLLKKDLEKMGFDIVERDRSVPEKPEFLCPQCDHVSEWPGECPQHHVKLLTFEEWNAQRRFRSDYYFRIFLLVVALVILYAIGSTSLPVLREFFGFKP